MGGADMALPLNPSGADWEGRINCDRMREERLRKVQEAMRKHGVDGLLLFKPENCRYAVGAQGMHLAWWIVEYAVVPQSGKPTFYPTGGDIPRITTYCPYLEGHVKPSRNLEEIGPARNRLAEEQIAEMLNEIRRAGLTGGVVGVDIMNFPIMEALQKRKIRLVDAEPIMLEARMIKTEDEILLIKYAAAMNDAALWHCMYELDLPGMREWDVHAELTYILRKFGCDVPNDGLRGIVASGERVNPYNRVIGGTDKIIRPGELVTIDSHVAFMGYHVDYTRTFMSSDIPKPTSEMVDINRRNLEYLYKGIEKVKPGNTTADVYRAWKQSMPPDWSRFTLDFGHGIGATGHEAPWVTEASEESPTEFVPGMTMAFETYISGGPGIASRIEENLVVTETGYEIISLVPHDPRLVGEEWARWPRWKT
jgi:Xaa-Pro aminopeptidase